MSNLETNVECANFKNKSITYENNQSCQHRQVIVLRIHIDYNFELGPHIVGRIVSMCLHQVPKTYYSLPGVIAKVPSCYYQKHALPCEKTAS